MKRHAMLTNGLLVLSICLLIPDISTLAQSNLTGFWVGLFHEDAPERLPGPQPGDYLELPINEAGRMRADSYDANRISAVEEFQCRPHGGDYSMRGLSVPLRVWEEYDPDTQQLVAIRTRTAWMEMERVIYMDGRPHPPEYAHHTWQGFSTGGWEGNMLSVTTTHLKPSYLRRNGVPRSATATFTDHWVRHGNYLTVTTFIDDPVFLTEPLVRSSNWVLDPTMKMEPYSCEPATEMFVPEGTVPHYLPGQNSGQNSLSAEFSDFFGIPFEAVRGGAETLYPEYRQKMGEIPTPPQCRRYCICTSLFHCPERPSPSPSINERTLE